eukprot:TRINITY_DN7122_c0_g1_i2.p1 TRINITY_DN7122_c0_g1~~TRINITY_DN7122_c0_g1_i2.p1  ORF type:complete len:625 (-),score=120.05 TRINITY_DN7122_c0_g1_i2:64-1938(-)
MSSPVPGSLSAPGPAGAPSRPGRMGTMPRGETGLVDASSTATAMGSTRGLRAVRLSRLNPGLMRRLDEARNCGDVSEDLDNGHAMLIQASKQASTGALPYHKAMVASSSPEPRVTATGTAESRQKWPLALSSPARSTMWEGLDPSQALSSSGRVKAGPAGSTAVVPGAASRRHLGLRRLPGEPLGPFGRDKLLDSFSQFRQNGGHLGPMSTSASRLELGEEAHLQELEALQHRCLELEALVAELRAGKRKRSKGTSSRPQSGRSSPLQEPVLDEQALGLRRRAEEAETRSEVLATELAEATAQLVETEDAARARLAEATASLRASEAACLGAVEAARDATEAKRRAEQRLAVEAANAERAAGAESVAAAAAKLAQEEARQARLVSRRRGFLAALERAEFNELGLQATLFQGWRRWLGDEHLARARESLQVQAVQLQHAERAVAAAEARVQAANAAAAEAEAREARAARRGAGGGSEKSLAAAARQRVLRGVEATLQSSERATVLTVMAAWRTALSTRRTVGSLQAALFAEEADRASAIRAQRSECDVLLLQAEARHRISLQRLRSELADAQALAMKTSESSAAANDSPQASMGETEEQDIATYAEEDDSDETVTASPSHHAADG